MNTICTFTNFHCYTGYHLFLSDLTKTLINQGVESSKRREIVVTNWKNLSNNEKRVWNDQAKIRNHQTITCTKQEIPPRRQPKIQLEMRTQQPKIQLEMRPQQTKIQLEIRSQQPINKQKITQINKMNKLFTMAIPPVDENLLEIEEL